MILRKNNLLYSLEVFFTGPDWKRIVYIDILRIVAIIAVIMIHVSADGFLSNLVPRTFEWHVHAFYDAIVRFGVPVFIMITGALYGDPIKEVSIAIIYKRNILRFFLSLLFWYVLFLKFHAEIVVLWFLFLIISLYMMIPFLRMVTREEEMTRYFLFIALVFSYALPQILDLPIWNGGGLLFKTIRWMRASFYGSSSWHLGFGYYSYFVIGYVCSRVKITKEIMKKATVIGICGFSYTVLVTEICSYIWDTKYDIFYRSLSLNVLAEAIFVFLFCRWFTEKVPLTQKMSDIIAIVADRVFGIYLVHLIVLRKLSVLIHPLEHNPIFMDVILVLLVFIISFAVSSFIHKIPVLRKYIV